MLEIFTNYPNLIISLHVLSAIIWIGGMITLRIAVYPAIQTIENPKIKLSKTLEIMKKLLNIVMPMVAILLGTATIMIIGFKFKTSSLYPIVLAKEAIWAIMSIIYSIIYVKRFRAEKLFNEGEYIKSKKLIKDIPNFLLPLNIILGIIALYLGVILQ